MNVIFVDSSNWLTEDCNVYERLGYGAFRTFWHSYYPWTLICSILLFATLIVIVALAVRHVNNYKGMLFNVTVYGKGVSQIKRGSFLFPDIPEKSGYVFCGWFKDSACSEPWRSRDKVKHDLTLYAKWSKEG